MIALLFPGQGSRRPGLLRAVDALPGGRETIEEASRVLRADVRATDDVHDIATDAAQRALFVAGVASARALAAAGVHPDAVAGHSIGTFAAAVVARALSFADALRIVDVRGREMAAAYPKGYAMGAVSGLSEAAVRSIVASQVSSAEAVFAANVNARDQITVAGTHAAVTRVLAAATARGARSVRLLNVPVPSHTPLMHAVALALRRAFENVDVATSSVWYLSNVDGRAVRRAEAIREDLILNVERPVRWDDGIHALHERGVRLFVEALPGTVLCDLATTAFRNARAVAMERTDIASIALLASRARSERSSA